MGYGRGMTSTQTPRTKATTISGRIQANLDKEAAAAAIPPGFKGTPEQQYNAREHRARAEFFGRGDNWAQAARAYAEDGRRTLASVAEAYILDPR